MSNRERYRKAKEIFDAALALEERERAGYLAQTCSGDELLLQEVQKLLAAYQEADTAWEAAVEAQVAEQFAASQRDETLYLIGQKLNNRYLVEAKLGSGSFGAAYLSVDRQLHAKRVVIKVLFAKQEQNEWAKKKFHQEITALSRINHPGVVGVFDTGSAPDGRPFFVMEFVDGVSLRSVKKAEGVMTFERVANIMQQLGRALSAAHDKGIYHRDLKPENIMLQSPGEDEQVKVIDFGMATVKESLDEATKATVVAGTIPYMAPEQLQGKPSASSDIYALGVIAYEMLTGKLPFSIPSYSNHREAVEKISEQQWKGLKIKPKELRTDLPSAAQEEILKALSYNPKRRHSRARDFGDNLANALAGSHIKQPAYFNKGDPASASLLRDEPPTEKIDPQINNRKASRSAQAKSSKKILPSMAAIALLASVTIGIAGLSYTKCAGDGASIRNAKERALSYWGELQPYRNGLPSGVTTRLTGGITGETYFDDGDGLRFYITPSDDGYLYLINEESMPDNGAPRYTMLFPSMEANNGSSKVNREQQVATSECIFDENTGTEKVWIIWSVKQISELDKTFNQWSNPTDNGVIKDAGQVEFLSKFIEKQSSAKVTVEPDESNERMKLRSNGDVLVYSLKLKHR